MDFIGLAIERLGGASLTDNPVVLDPFAPAHASEAIVPVLHGLSEALTVMRDNPDGLAYVADYMRALGHLVDTATALSE